MTPAETMARWTGENVVCCNPFTVLPNGFDHGNDELRSQLITEVSEVIAALEALPLKSRAGFLATDPSARRVIVCGCEPFATLPWADIEPDEKQCLRIRAARWIGAWEATANA